MKKISKVGTIAVLQEAEELVVNEVKRLRASGQYANKKMVATNAIYDSLGSPQIHRGVTNV